MTGGPAGGDPVFGGPEAPEERKAVTDAQLRFTARERELALAERSHQRWFRVVMMALVPLVTVACLSLVAWLIISERDDSRASGRLGKSREKSGAKHSGRRRGPVRCETADGIEERAVMVPRNILRATVSWVFRAFSAGPGNHAGLSSAAWFGNREGRFRLVIGPRRGRER